MAVTVTPYIRAGLHGVTFRDQYYRSYSKLEALLMCCFLAVLNVSLILAIPAVAIFTRSCPALGSTRGRDKSLLSSLKTPDRLCDPHSLLFSGYGAISPGAKQPGGETDHSCLFSAEVSSGDILPPPSTPL
jgi:hypothetical protein